MHRLAIAPLRVDHRLHLGERAAGIEDVARDREPACRRARRGRTRALRPARRSAFWRRSAGASGSLTSTCMTSRASSAGPMPRPIGCRPSVITTSRWMPSVVADVLEQLAQALRRAHLPHLGGRPDGNVDEEVRRAGGELLRQDRRHHLPVRVDAERPLDRDQDVVGGREAGRAAPGDAAAVLAHDVVQRPEAELDAREHLHGVGGAGRRGDRAARRLRDQHAVRGDDRHDDHRGAVARNAADAVLVGDQRLVPVEALARIEHRAGQVQHLVAVELALAGGDQECGDLGLGEVVLGDVADDVAIVVGQVEPLAGDLAAHGVHRRRRLGLRDAHEASLARCRAGRTPVRTGPARSA